MGREVKKAVIPVAGLGTRFLPMTKSVPKELLPIVDKPAIQYVIEEAVESGIETIILVTSPEKAAVIDYLTHNPKFAKALEKIGKDHLLEDLNAFISRFDVRTAIQKEPKGLGHAVYCARKEVGDEPFVLLLPDMIIVSDPPCSKQLIDVYGRVGHGVIYTEHMPRERLHAYGVIDIESSVGPLYKIKTLVEKPEPGKAPSDLIIVGRYLLPPSIFGLLEDTKPGKGGEIQITDALSELAATEGLYAFEHEAKIFDTGDKLGYLKANFYFGLKSKEFGPELRKYLGQLM